MGPRDSAGPGDNTEPGIEASRMLRCWKRGQGPRRPITMFSKNPIAFPLSLRAAGANTAHRYIEIIEYSRIISTVFSLFRFLEVVEGTGRGNGAHGGGGDVLFEVAKEVGGVTGGQDTFDIRFHHIVDRDIAVWVELYS